MRRFDPVTYLSLTFDQPLGAQVEAGGYHLDMRVKAKTPDWPPPALLPLEDTVWVATCQWGLGAFEHFLATQDERWLTAARAAAEHLLAAMTEGGPLDGGLPHAFPYPHTFDLPAGWLSAMAQGEAASLLVRLHAATGEERYAAAARRALGPLWVAVADGGVGRAWEGGWWLEEYPTEPGTFVLNGAIFALWGVHDVAAALGDEDARQRFEDGVELLAANVWRWDRGWWSSYDLYPFRVPNIASLAYQELHPAQLTALDRVRPDPRLRARAARFEAQLASRRNAARAMVAKVVFRLAYPRR